MDDVGLGAGLLACILFAVVGTAVLACTTSSDRTRTFQTNLFLCGLAARFAFAVVIYQFGLVNTIKDEDGSGWLIGLAYKTEWERQALTLVDLPALLAQAYSSHHRGYYYLVGWFFFATGLEGRLAAAALNCAFGSMTAVLIYRTSRQLLPERAAVWAGWFTCLFPSLIMWSAQTIKEPVVIFLEAVVLAAAVRLRSAFSPGTVAVCVLAIVALIPFRFYAAYVAMVTVLVGVALPSTRLTSADIARLLGIGGVALLLAFAGGVLQQEASAQYLDVAYVDNFRRNAAQGQGSGVYVEADLGTSAGLGVALAVGGLHLMLAPFPWQWFGGIRRLLVAPEVVFWWWLLWCYVLPGAKYVISRSVASFAPVLVFLVMMSLLYSVMFSNVGLVYRHRAQLLPWLFIIAAAGREVLLRRGERAATQVGGRRDGRTA